MSLKEVVLEIADEMEKVAKEDKHHYDVLTSYAKQLRRACKAAATDPVAEDSFAFNPEKGMFLQTEAHTALKKMGTDAKQEERLSASMIWCVGGPADETMVENNPTMPNGAKTFVCGVVYQKTDGKLHYCAKDTEQYQRSQLQAK